MPTGWTPVEESTGWTPVEESRLEPAVNPDFKGNQARNKRQAQGGSQRTTATVEQLRRETTPDTSNPLNPTNYVYNGVIQAGKGTQEFGRGDYTKGLSDMIRGVGTTAAPFTVPLAVTTAPLATLLGYAGGSTGAALGGGAARALGATDGQVSLAEDVGGILGGSAGSLAAPKLRATASSMMDRAKRSLSTIRQLAADNPKIAEAVLTLASPRVAAGREMMQAIREAQAAPVGPIEPPVASVSAPVQPAVVPQPTPIHISDFMLQADTPEIAATPEGPPPQATITPWDPSTLSPDPFKQTEAFQKGLESLRARRIGAPDVNPSPATTTIPEVMRNGAKFDPQFFGEVKDITPGAYEAVPRQIKAAKAVALAREYGITTKDLANMSDSQYKMLSDALAAKYPDKWTSKPVELESDATRAQIIDDAKRATAEATLQKKLSKLPSTKINIGNMMKGKK